MSTDGDYIPLSMLQMLRPQGAPDPPCEVFVFRMLTRSGADDAPTAKRQCLPGGAAAPPASRVGSMSSCSSPSYCRRRRSTCVWCNMPPPGKCWTTGGW